MQPSDSHQDIIEQHPLVSVILPVFNGEAFVGQTIESALCQTYRNIEVIVIDDGSTDRTLERVARLAERDSRVRVIRQARGGVACARNRGIAEARGEFIAPLDADDLWDPTKIERQVCRLNEAGEQTGLVYCWWVWIDQAGAVLDRSPSWRLEGDTLETLLQVNYTGNASVPLYRRRCLQEVGGYDENLERQGGRGCEDWDLALKVAARYHVAVVPALLVGYRRLRGSMSTDFDVMRHSQVLVVNGLRRRDPDLASELFLRSSDQFALYIAGVLFWSGAYWRAFAAALGAWRSGLLFRVLPYAIRVFVRRVCIRSAAHTQVMAPGVPLEAARISGPLVPYDRIYDRYAHTGTSKKRLGGWLRSSHIQTLATLLAFLLIAGLHASNDGLWFQGDAPRHAANGFFWWDLIGKQILNPMAFALSYYARYPVINPVTYPPLFYLLEGLAFHSISPSPVVAKCLVFSFGVLAGFYTLAWARRWMGAAAGWAGALLALTPGVVIWTNAVMLNIPAMALGMACLYHFRSSLESRSKKQFLAALIFAAAVVLTYYPGAIVVCVCFVWELLFRCNLTRWRDKAKWAAAALGVAFIPLAIAVRLAPVLSARYLPGIANLMNPRSWTFYLTKLPSVTGVLVLVLGITGFSAGCLVDRWQREAAYIGSWIATPILALALVPARDSRYILLLAPAFVIALFLGFEAAAELVPRRYLRWRSLLFAALFMTSIWLAARVTVPKASGFREVAAYLRQNAPADSVLYDGYHDGLFGFYIRAMDPQFQQRIVLAEELLYQYGPTTSFNWVETSKAATTDDVVRILQQQSGCRWLVIEVGANSEWARGQRLLRQALDRPEFELVRSFPVSGTGARRIDLYRVVSPGPEVTTVNLYFPSFSSHEFLQITPIAPLGQPLLEPDVAREAP